MADKVVITGMGAVCPIGLTVEEAWQNLVMGISGVGPISLFDPKDLLVKIACEVKNFRPEDYLSPKEIRRRDRYQCFAAAAVRQAVRQAGLDGEKGLNVSDPTRVGAIISAAIGGLNAFVDTQNVMRDEGPRKISPFAIPMLMPNGAASMTALDYHIQGPCFSAISACASGSEAIGLGWLLIRSGIIDVAVVGGSEATISPLGVATFDRLGALSRKHDDFSMTPAPFDLNRDGLVMGEGSGIVILEREQHARDRNVPILAELAGYGSSNDAFHITAPSEDGSGGSYAIRSALSAAGISHKEVDYINAHGTATALNDTSETKAIKLAFGDDAYRVPVSSTKSMTGHMMGATCALETIFCVNAIRDSIVPPTIHYQTPDPACDLDVVPNVARKMPVHVAMNNAFGFGGHNVVLIIREYSHV
jgi:beta-ketoacyl-acyl-carrier-protein synthase II